ncbi:helix-turn-helix domain-containing protein [Anthocerotibacter panamensis]|uniref:helix-turn-helix domain-containing protein n=1 Tax=Anthocerotibacter panamensis TaxID=2857077 RepID=UPI001C4061A1|nr:helix-turn-helix domain-containing protein [Anthocerotibacter panamensis]
MKSGLTLSEVSRITGRSVRTVRRWIAEGRLKTRIRESHEPANTPTRVDEKELERFLAATHRMVRTGESGPESYDSDVVAEQVYQQLRTEMMPLVEDLRTTLSRMQAQIEVLHREHEALRERVPNNKPVSPWRKLLGVD